jgi:hypothetical protein
MEGISLIEYQMRRVKKKELYTTGVNSNIGKTKVQEVR